MNLEIPDIIWSCWDNGAPHGLSIMFKTQKQVRISQTFKKNFTKLFADPETQLKYVLHFVSTKICNFEKLAPVSILE